MKIWIQHILSSDQAGFTVLFAVFLLGLISLFTCACNFSIIGLVAGYSGSTGSSLKLRTAIWNGLSFLIGIVTSMSVIGAIIGYASELISISFGNYWKIAAGLISIFFGLLSIDFLPFKIPEFTFSPKKNSFGIFSSFVFGLTIGGLTLALSTCCNPIFPILLAVSFVKGSTVWGVLLLSSYATGYGLMFSLIYVGISLGFGKATKAFSKVGTIIKYAGGVTMLIIGFYLLLTI